MLTGLPSDILAAASSPTAHRVKLYRFFSRWRNFPLFLRFFFPEKFSCEFGELHLRLFELLENKKPGLAIAYPRGHAKTTILGFGYVMWCMLYRYENIVYFSNKTNNAKNEVRNLLFALRENELLQKTYQYKILATGGGALEVEVWRYDKTARQPKVYAVRVLPTSIREGIRGTNYHNKRPELIILDDIEKDSEVRNGTLRRRLEEWLTGVVVPLGHPETRYIFIGTILHYDSLLKKICHAQFMAGFWTTAVERALGVENTPSWPALWSREKLLTLRTQLGTKIFSREYQNEVTDDEDAIIRAGWIQTAQWEGQAGIKVDGMVFSREQLRIFVALDPAISQGEQADYSALCVVGTLQSHEKKYYFVLKSIRGKWSMLETVRQLVALDAEWHPHEIGVEVVAYQRALSEVLKRQSLPIRELHPDMDKTRRLLCHQGKFEFGEVYFLPGNEELITELTQFPHARHDDQVDALSYALEMAGAEGLSYIFGV